MRPAQLAIILAACTSTPTASAFSPPSGQIAVAGRLRAADDASLLPPPRSAAVFRTTRESSVEACLFRRLLRRGDKKKNEGDDDDDSEAVEAKHDDDAPSGAAESNTGVDQLYSVSPSSVSSPPSASEPEVAVAAETAKVAPPPAPVPAVPPQVEAERLRAAAEKVRLEAEKMEVTLTIEKIAKLEKELGSKVVEKDPDRASQIRRDIDSLKRKLSGEDVASAPAPKPTAKKVEDEEEDRGSEPVGQSSLVTATAVSQPEYEPMAADELEARVQKYVQSPKFMKEIVAKTAGIDFMDISEVNATALVLQLYEDELKYLDIQKGMTGKEQQMPQFSQKQIDEKVKELEVVPQFVKNFYGKNKDNDTAIAIQMLETEYESDNLRRQLMRAMEANAEEEREAPTKSPSSRSKSDEETFGSTLFGEAFDQAQKTETEKMVEALFPPSTRKEGATPSQAQANILMADVLTKIKLFSPSGKPEPVPGGFIIRGTNQFDSGQELIDAIDSAIANSRVKEQLLVNYVGDPTPVTDEQMLASERNPVLFVTSTDVTLERNRFLLAGVTSLAIGTSWYTSLYPFLLNPTLLKSSEEQLNLANAGMEYDLGFLTDIAVPLFASFMGVQVAHEAAHWVVASAKKMEITFPTLVPSLVTGITSSITALKKSPKNKQDLFDFAIAGPLTGVVISCALIFLGCGLTASLDSAAYSQLPGLPLAVLRQSALAGGIIEYVLGEGLLSVPASAAGTEALADINISLHPFAIAGFFGLLVNAINLVPFGRTDGGRVSLALFGRSGAQAAGLFALIALFIQGLFSSDLLLFYFAFITFFQSEAEIPCRNEVDDITFGRVLLATLSGVLVLLSLIPMG